MGQQAHTTPQIEAFIRAASLQAAAVDDESTTAKTVLEAILLGKFTSEATNGKTVVSVGEGGSTTSWTVLSDLSPADVMNLAHAALCHLEQTQEDPDDPDVSGFRRATRLRCSFRKAVI